MNDSLYELRKTLAKQARNDRAKLYYYKDCVEHSNPLSLSFYGNASSYNYWRGAYDSSRKAWTTVVEKMQ